MEVLLTESYEVSDTCIVLIVCEMFVNCVRYRAAYLTNVNNYDIETLLHLSATAVP